MYDIVFSPSAEKQLSRLERVVQQRIISALERIKIRPEDYLKRLVDEPGYRLRVGDYRVILDVEGKSTILVLKIGHRKNIYK